jgi:hypothetical protein
VSTSGILGNRTAAAGVAIKGGVKQRFDIVADKQAIPTADVGASKDDVGSSRRSSGVSPP